MMSLSISSRRSPHSKWGALHDTDNELCQPIVARRCFTENRAHSRCIVMFKPPPQRIRHHLFCQRCHKSFGREQFLSKTGRTFEGCATREDARRIDRAGSFAESPPSANGIEVFQCKPK